METGISDTSLILASQEGDEQAFAQLVGRHLASVYRFCIRYIGNSDDADDAAQITFFKAWKSIEKFDTKKSFTTWIFTLARNSSIDILRRRSAVPFGNLSGQTSAEKHGDSFEDSLVDQEALPDELFMRQEISEEIARALGGLSSEDRSLLSLRYEENVSFEEIATILSVPSSSVRSRHRRAIAQLRKLLGV
jgi:RNA polymerase sigma-70 factor (ECF subfamily)